jgi:hypothetical protein
VGKGEADWIWQKADRSEVMTAVAGNGDSYIIVGNESLLKTSDEGLHWTTQSYGGQNDFFDITVVRNKYIVVGEGPSARVVTTTEAGMSWRNYDTGQEQPLFAVSASSKTVLAVGAKGEALTTTDGTVWTRSPAETNADLRDVIDFGMWSIVVGDSGTVLKTTEGRHWIDWETGFSHDFLGVAANNRAFVFVTREGLILKTNSTHSSWETYDVAGGRCLNGVTWTGQRFIAVGDDGFVATSADGSCWST